MPQQLRVGRGLVGEEAGPGRRVDRPAACVLHRQRQPGERVVRHVPQGEIVEVIADGQRPRRQPADRVGDDAVVQQGARQPASPRRLGQPAIEGLEVNLVRPGLADGHVVMRLQVVRPCRHDQRTRGAGPPAQTLKFAPVSGLRESSWTACMARPSLLTKPVPWRDARRDTRKGGSAGQERSASPVPQRCSSWCSRPS